MPRPKTYSDDAKVAVASAKAKSRLQDASERRAIVLKIIDNGGRMTFAELTTAFGFDMRAKVISLINGGWLEVVK